MLVVENRYEAPGSLHGGDHLVEEPFSRILDLSQFGAGVAAVFSDGEHGVDGQGFAAHTQRVVDRLEDRQLVRLGDGVRHVGFAGSLIGVDRDDVDTGIGGHAVEQVGPEEILEDHVGVRSVRTDRVDRRHPGTWLGSSSQRACQWQGQGASGDALEKPSP